MSRRNIFGWYYPPGCSGPPDEDRDPHPLSEKVYDLLEKAGTQHEIICEICDEIEQLVDIANMKNEHVVLQQELFNNYKAARNEALEEAAVVADNFDFGLDSQSGLVADIRALKEKP